jgi:hypothetical protein
METPFTDSELKEKLKETQTFKEFVEHNIPLRRTMVMGHDEFIDLSYDCIREAFGHKKREDFNGISNMVVYYSRRQAMLEELLEENGIGFVEL